MSSWSRAWEGIRVRHGTVAGISVRLLRVGFVGELGYEIHAPAAFGEALWDALMAPFVGILHAACEGQASWYDVACATLEYAGVEGVQVEPCTSAAFPRPAPRPAYSVLNCGRLAALRGRPLAHWQDALKTYLGNEDQ